MTEPPTMEEIENDPKQYYPFLIDILQCFGCNYFDKQGTEKGRGGEITILQKVSGVTERIATVFSLKFFNNRWRSSGMQIPAHLSFPSFKKLGRRI